MHRLLRHGVALFRKGRPIQLTYFVTRRCNARCPFCFYLAQANEPEPRAPELSAEEILRLAPSLGRLLWVLFSGGEPYLRRDLAELSRAFHKHNRPAFMLYPTNGLMPEIVRARTEEILNTCPRSVIAVKLSLDGIGADHDALRRTPGGFDRLMETYALLAPLAARYPHFELGVNTVFCSENQDRIDRIIDFVKDLPAVRTHTVSLVRGRLRDPRYLQIDPERYRRVIERIEGELSDRTMPVYRFRGAGVKAAQDVLQRRLIYATLNARRRLLPCYAGRLNLVLTESGDVYPCELLERCMGNVREVDYDMRRLLRTARARTIAAEVRDGRCYCTHECNWLTNILFNPATYPALAHQYYALRRSRPREIRRRRAG